MAQLTADRNTPRREGENRTGLLGASQAIFAGAILMRNAAGNLVEGATATGSYGVGISMERLSSVSADTVGISYRPGVFRVGNSSAGDAITKADIGAACYIVDDQTVAKTHATNTRSPAGIVEDVDAQGVWVRFDEALTRAVLS